MSDKDRLLICANLIIRKLFSIIFKNCDIAGDTEHLYFCK